MYVYSIFISDDFEILYLLFYTLLLKLHAINAAKVTIHLFITYY